MDGASVLAVILDLDGTLLDTERATGGLLKKFLEGYGKVLDPEKEDRRLGKMHKEAAAEIVVDYDLPLTAEEFSAEIMPMYRERWGQAKALPGANRLIRHLHKHGIPLALASNSIRKHIDVKISYQKGWKESFTSIIGGDDVIHGKPSPDMFLESAKRMGVDVSRCLVIEDSLVGVAAARAAGMNIVAVPSLPCRADHYAMADCVLHSLLEFQPDIWGLPAFDDWIHKVLPIEPLHANGILHEGALLDCPQLMDEFAENDSSTSLPCQLSGIFFGWAKLGTHGVFKLAVSIEWNISSNGIKRLIKPCILSEVNNDTVGKLLIIIVGYIWKMNREETKEDPGMTRGITKEDAEIADAALDLPTFAEHKGDPFLAE